MILIPSECDLRSVKQAIEDIAPEEV